MARLDRITLKNTALLLEGTPLHQEAGLHRHPKYLFHPDSQQSEYLFLLHSDDANILVLFFFSEPQMNLLVGSRLHRIRLLLSLVIMLPLNSPPAGIYLHL
jgi:hypothetical protein